MEEKGKMKGRKLKAERKEKGFRCSNCGRQVSFLESIGTKHRNHCPFCLWSKHLDLKKPGDRKSNCKAVMEPIGLTFKQEGIDKYGKLRQGELMLVHKCTGCGKISINRIAADDNPEAIIKLLEKGEKIDQEGKKQLKKVGIKILSKEDEKEVFAQLFGKVGL